jgi:hypothetical protein
LEVKRKIKQTAEIIKTTDKQWLIINGAENGLY